MTASAGYTWLMTEIIRADLSRPDRRGLDYAVCTQFLFMHLACLLAFWTGVSAAAVAVCLGLYVVRMFAITAGFHRLFSHRSYRTGRPFQFLLAFAGTARSEERRVGKEGRSQSAPNN